jgi:hypothetical protein
MNLGEPLWVLLVVHRIFQRRLLLLLCVDLAGGCSMALGSTSLYRVFIIFISVLEILIVQIRKNL